jgi:hypothetical protein
MDADTPRQRPRVRWPFLVALGLAACGLGARYTVLASGATRPHGTPLVTLSGVTGQGTTIELGIQNHRVQWLNTSLNAKCAGGPSWRETWAPAEGAPVHFAMVGATFTTEQRVAPTYRGGIVGRIAFTIRGTLISKDAAQGTIRLVARFYRGEQQWNACDSLDVAWAVGPRVRARLQTVALGRQTGEYYPAVPSLATDVSPARREFIAWVDGTCVSTYRAMTQAEDAAEPTNDEYGVRLHQWQYGQLTALGQPPQARALYDAWLANFRRRLALETQELGLEGQHQHAALHRVAASLDRLKAQGNLVGQEFGLVRCTSNGDRTPVPILDDGQPLPLP